ncbi:MAG: helix-turn-helix domain-containing protein [Flavobacterium sp.]|nr:helix-turn-helix domain-containing protein [Flavobacterium sp.]
MAIETDRFANSADKNRMYREQIITREDLNEFRSLLLNDLKEIFQSNPQQTKQWLKSNEVRKLLNISPGTLQNLRINGTLTYTKIGGIMYYDNSDIDKLLNGNKVNALPTLFK